MIIDSHTHSYKDKEKFYSPEDLISSMDEAGIDYSMLIADGTVGGTTDTEKVIEICEKYPRLKAVGNIEYKTLDSKQVETLTKYLENSKLHAVKLYPGYENFYPQDEKLFPFYEKCESLGKPIIIHTGLLMEGLPGFLKQSHPLNIDEVASRFPNLKIIMAHFGNPWLVDAVAVVYRNINVYVDLSGYFEIFKPIPKGDVDFLVQDMSYFKNFVGSFERCLFGTDWPLYSQKEYLEAVQKIPMTDEEKERVFWRNASELFSLSLE